MKRKLITTFIISTTMLFSQVYATTISELKEEQEKVQSEAEEAKKLLEETSSQKDAVISEIELIDEELNLASEELEIINTNLEETTLLLEQTEAELKQAETERENQYETLKERLRFMYVNGKIGYLEVLFKASSFSDFLNRVEYISRIYEYDHTLLEKLKETEELVNRKLSEVSIQKEEIEELKVKQQVKMESLEHTIKQKQIIIDQLDADEQKYEEQISELEQLDIEIAKMIKEAEEEAARIAAEAKAQAEAEAQAKAKTRIMSYQTEAANYNGGTLAWPGGGRITSNFGGRTNPINGRSEFHTGIDIAAPTGTNIVAAEGGVVIFSGTMGGYGKAVLIDHGGGLSTFYAHNSKLLVQKGDVVSRGEVVAKAGSTGYSTGPHLHFEVKVNGSAVNPMNYLR